MTRARIPQEGERVQMGKFATAFRGVWGQVIKVKYNPPPVPGTANDLLSRPRLLQDGNVIPGAGGGANHTEIYIATDLRYNGKRVVVKASPYELDGGVLDDRPIIARR